MLSVFYISKYLILYVWRKLCNFGCSTSRKLKIAVFKVIANDDQCITDWRKNVIEIELLTRVWKTKLATELYLFVRDITLKAKCYVLSPLFSFLETLYYTFFTINFCKSWIFLIFYHSHKNWKWLQFYDIAIKMFNCFSWAKSGTRGKHFTTQLLGATAWLKITSLIPIYPMNGLLSVRSRGCGIMTRCKYQGCASGGKWWRIICINNKNKKKYWYW